MGPSCYSDGTERFVRVETIGGRRRLQVAFRALRPSGITAAWVRTAPDGEAEHRALRSREDGPWERWEGAVSLRNSRQGYRFALQVEGGALWFLNQRGLGPVEPYDDADFVHLDDAPPTWLAGRTFYQIFPDRFARAGRAVPDDGGLLPWGVPPPGYRQGGVRVYYGGDLAGIRRRLGYLQDLGVGAVCLAPIFLAGTNHRYDVRDHHRIDPLLGGEQEFAALCRELHEGDLRLILDGVFNHVGDGHRWFNRYRLFPEPGAWQDAASPWAEFFYFHRHPDRYECWLGHRELVKLNYRSRRLRDEIYGAPGAVVRRWLRPPYAVDGWRLDAANMIGRCGATQEQADVLQELRRAARSTQEDAYLLGETYYDPSDLLAGDQLDGVMNYHGFTFPVLRWLTGRDPQRPRGLRSGPPADPSAAALARDLDEARVRVPFASMQAQFNLLGSHDTARILTRLGGDRDRLRLAVALLLTWPGVPAVYYGDEIGLSGGGDPDNRGCMEWDESHWDHDLRLLYRDLIALRRRMPELARGGATVLHAAAGVFVFARVLGGGAVVVALNRDPEPVRLAVPVAALGMVEGTAEGLMPAVDGLVEDGRLGLELGPWDVAILRLDSGT